MEFNIFLYKNISKNIFRLINENIITNINKNKKEEIDKYILDKYIDLIIS